MLGGKAFTAFINSSNYLLFIVLCEIVVIFSNSKISRFQISTLRFSVICLGAFMYKRTPYVQT